MKINSRLKAIGDLVDEGSVTMDVGCDHALLSVYLVVEKKHKKAIASDIKEGPLHSAEENIKRYQVEDKIELRLGDGLSTYTDEIDTVTISGIGGRTMIGIFKSNLKTTKKIKTIIASPNNYQQDVREFLTSIGFQINDETLVKEGKIIYQIMKFTKGKSKLSKKEKFFGPILLQKKGKLFTEYFKREKLQREILIDILPKNYRLKKYLLKKEIKMIEEEI